MQKMQTFSFPFAFQGCFFIIWCMRIWFFGTPSLSAAVLHDLLESVCIEVVVVVTNPDKPIGRSGEIQPSPVKVVALAHNIPVLTPIKIRENHDFFSKLKDYDCDYFIVVAYGRILPLSLLEMPRQLSINIHGSILPLYRGASPIQSALLSGDIETGVTIMKMSEGMDEWDILKIHTISIDSTETSATLFEKFAQVSGTILIQTLRELETGGITPLPQDSHRATYCKKIEKEDGLIDWNESARAIYQKWQAYTPWPGIYTVYEGKRLLLERVNYAEFKLQDSKPWAIMKIENSTIGVICGEWILTLEQVKLEWKKSQSIKDFLNGNQKFISTNF